MHNGYHLTRQIIILKLIQKEQMFIRHVLSVEILPKTLLS